MEKNVLIVHFNTPELTRAAILSIKKHTSDAVVTVFDNSDKMPFPPMDGVRIIDNTGGQLIDFDKFLGRFSSKRRTHNNWGSAKHSYTIDYLFDLFPGGFVLMDSDVLIKKDISDFFDTRCAFVGQIRQRNNRKTQRVARLLPFLCWINVPMCVRHGIRYFDCSRSWKLRNGPPETWYDTGASFLEDCVKKRLPVRNVRIDEYMVHFGAGSWRGEDSGLFLENYKEYYE